MARLDWLVHRATAAEEEIVALLRELNRRRASLPAPIVPGQVALR